MTVRPNHFVMPFATLRTTLATNTTLGTSTRHNFAAITVPCPETSSRTFLSAEVVVRARCAATSAANYTGARIGINFDGGAYDDADQTPTAIANSGDHELLIFKRNVTALMNANFGAGVSQLISVGVAFSQASAGLVSNVNAELVITYEADDASATILKFARIPIQAHHTALTNVQVEIGTTGGANDAPANQIPILDNYLVEDNVSIKSYTFVPGGADAGATTTDFNAIVQVDATAEVNLGTLEQALATSVPYYDRVPIDPATHVTSAAHALKLRSSLTARFDAMGGWIEIVYTCDSASADHLVSRLEIAELDGNGTPFWPMATTSSDDDLYKCEIWVEEPGPITMLQSGVVMLGSFANGGTLVVAAGAQSGRTYTLGNVAGGGTMAIVHRGDHSSSGWTLARGRNTLTMKARTGTAKAGCMTVLVMVNYTCARAAQGPLAHAKTLAFSVVDALDTSTTEEPPAVATPVLPAEYFINSSWLWSSQRSTGGTPTAPIKYFAWLARRDAGGWWSLPIITEIVSIELAAQQAVLAMTRAWKRDPNRTVGDDIEAARRWRTYAMTTTHILATLFATVHQIAFTISGTIDGVGAGVAFDVWSSIGEKVASGTTGVDGAFSATVYDSANTHFVTCGDARSDAFTPGNNPVDFGGSSGGGVDGSEFTGDFTSCAC